MKIKFLTFLFFTYFSCACLFATEKNFVTAKCTGQLGNNMFQVAAASVVAWENNAIAIFPNLSTPINKNYQLNIKHIFFRCETNFPIMKFKNIWKEPSMKYTKIPYLPNLEIQGYFQSEKYFKDHRESILKLFAPLDSDLEFINKKYGRYLNDPSITTVGLQLRWYFEDKKGIRHHQYGKDYLTKATALFPGALFLVSTNNKEFAEKSMPANINVVYLDDPYYIDLRTLSLCQHNIISNSSFGWWGAWLNVHPNKIVVTPNKWSGYSERIENSSDIKVDGWIRIQAKRGNSSDYRSCE